jgi:hypothetical protein
MTWKKTLQNPKRARVAGNARVTSPSVALHPAARTTMVTAVGLLSTCLQGRTLVHFSAQRKPTG